MPMKTENGEEIYEEAEILNEDDRAPAPPPIPKKRKKKKKPPESFGLDWTNGVLFGICVIVLTGFFFSYRETTAESISRFCGSIFALVFVPALLSFIVWAIARNKTATTITFNALVALLSIGNLATMILPNHPLNFLAKKDQRETVLQMEQDKKLLRNRLGSTDDPDKAREALEEYNSNLQKSLGKMAQSHTGKQRQALEILQIFASENNQLIKKWQDSFEGAKELLSMDYSQIKNNGEFSRRKQIAKTYISETRAYLKLFNETVPKLTQRLAPLGSDERFIKEMLEGARQKNQSQKRPFEAAMNEHIVMGNTLLEMLDLLEKNQSAWSLKDGQLEISDDNTLDKYNKLFETIQATAEKIDKYTQEIVNQI